ncbi:unnamed protein product [Durusdinium trenchii]|uniref:Uncharacterized protein n=1 Tax=Durusdinium trenchii TaxID=1381693 RepID=A0ABP0PDD5_9DINO
MVPVRGWLLLLCVWRGAGTIVGHKKQMRSHDALNTDVKPGHEAGVVTQTSIVTVDFFVMSKCPDAKLCEETFLPVLKDLASLVSVNFTYLGTIAATGSQCMHGPSECEGDMQRLCVQEAASTEKLLRFAMCQDAAI